MWIKTKSSADGTATKLVRSTDIRLFEIHGRLIRGEIPLSQFSIEVMQIEIYVPDAFEDLSDTERRERQTEQIKAAVLYLQESLEYKRVFCDMTSFTEEEYGADAITEKEAL